MKTINIVIAIATFSFFSCGSAKKIANFKINKELEKETLMPLEQSFSTIPITIPLEYFYTDLKTRLKGFIIQNQDFPDYTNLDHCEQAKYQLTVDNIAFSNPDPFTLLIHVDLHYIIWGRTCKGPSGAWKYGDCENDGDKLLSFAVRLKFPYPLTNNSLGAAILENIDFHDTDCEVGFTMFGKEAHKELAEKLKCSIEKQINDILQQSFLQTASTTLSSKIKPDIFFTIDKKLPRGNIKLKINNIHIGKMSFASDSLNLVAGVYYSAIICTEDTKPDIPLQAVTKNKILEFSDQEIGLNNHVAAVVSYETINIILKDALVKYLPADGIVRLKRPLKFVKFKISDTKISGDDYGYLNIIANTQGFPNTTINIKFYPIINSLSNTLILKNVSYTIETKNLLVKIVKPFYKKSIQKAINNNGVIQYKNPLSNYTTKITTKINDLNLKYFTPNISDNNITIIDIKPTVDYLVIYITQSGVADLKIKSNNIAIPLPTSPYKPANSTCK